MGYEIILSWHHLYHISQHIEIQQKYPNYLGDGLCLILTSIKHSWQMSIKIYPQSSTLSYKRDEVSLVNLSPPPPSVLSRISPPPPPSQSSWLRDKRHIVYEKCSHSLPLVHHTFTLYVCEIVSSLNMLKQDLNKYNINLLTNML